MRFLLDTNISPGLCSRLRAAGHEAVHWSSVGVPNARDEVIIGFFQLYQCPAIHHDFCALFLE
jgi:predicted nuclease of predicted toxin-antitoxin system